MAIEIWVMCQFTSDGVFRKDYGNRNRKQLVSVYFAKQGTETGNTYGPGRPARPPEAKIDAAKKLFEMS
jgi:hypothetical protein